MHLLIQCEVKDEFRAKGLNLETCLGQMYSLQRETYSCQNIHWVLYTTNVTVKNKVMENMLVFMNLMGIWKLLPVYQILIQKDFPF